MGHGALLICSMFVIVSNNQFPIPHAQFPMPIPHSPFPIPDFYD